MLFWKFEVVSREAGALEVGAWRFEARQSFEPALELFLGIVHSVTPIVLRPSPQLTSVAWFH
jgi:hypothetical protein